LTEHDDAVTLLSKSRWPPRLGLALGPHLLGPALLFNVQILAGSAARQWHADCGKPRTFVLCEKKQ